MLETKNKKKKKPVEVLSVQKTDRRILSNVPDPENIRTLADRRGLKNIGEDNRETEPEYIKKLHEISMRYMADFDVVLIKNEKNKKVKINAHSVDISSSGILLEVKDSYRSIKVGEKYQLRFDIPPGTMPEGFESKVKIDALVVRCFNYQDEDEEKLRVAFEFDNTLFSYFQKKRWGYSAYTASGLLFLVVLLVMLMRVESIIYFKYNMFLYFYSITTATFLLSRYFFGALYRNVPINPDYTPGVSIIIPCFNEEKWIQRTILSCVNQDYPIDKLEVIIVDDCSTDRSAEKIQEIVQVLYSEAERYNVKNRLKALMMPKNGGKREALVKGVEIAKHELVVFVDSDSFLEPTAIKNLVQPFQDPKMGGVTGRTDVANKFTNSVTKMQTVRYYIAFRIMKAAEAYFDCVTCLSGPISCYRKELIVKHAHAWLNQKFLGQPATFGDDRSMTNFILRTYRTGYQDNAICSTIVPSDIKMFLRQQMRWKRSWLRESLIAGSFIWKKEPFMALFFYMGVIVPIAAPVVVLYNLVYIPIAYNTFPITFMLGLLLMALLMSFSHLLFRKSKLWVFGMVFCLFYELILLWQMPVAWVTFWKSTWGTRETIKDVEARNKKKYKRSKKNKFANNIKKHF